MLRKGGGVKHHTENVGLLSGWHKVTKCLEMGEGGERERERERERALSMICFQIPSKFAKLYIIAVHEADEPIHSSAFRIGITCRTMNIYLNLYSTS